MTTDHDYTGHMPLCGEICPTDPKKVCVRMEGHMGYCHYQKV